MSLGLREAQWKLADLIRANGSVEDLFKLAEEVSGNVAEATPEDTFLLQSGHLVDGAPAGTSTGTINLPNVHDIGNSPVGQFVNGSQFRRTLRDAIGPELGVSDFDAAPPEIQRAINEKFDFHMSGLDPAGKRVSSPY